MRYLCKLSIMILALWAVVAYADGQGSQDAATITTLQTLIGGLLTLVIGGVWYSLKQIHKKLDGQETINNELFTRIRKAEDKANKVMAQHQIAVETGKCPAMLKLAEICTAGGG